MIQLGLNLSTGARWKSTSHTQYYRAAPCSNSLHFKKKIFFLKISLHVWIFGYMYVCVPQKPKRVSDHLGLELGAGWEWPVLLTTELFPTLQSPNSPLLQELSPLLNVIGVRQISPQNRDKGLWNSLVSKGQTWWPCIQSSEPTLWKERTNPTVVLRAQHTHCGIRSPLPNTQWVHKCKF